MSKTYNIQCISEALSPISHMSGTSGNEGIVAREPVMTPKGKLFVPYLSGNAIRHRCVRAPGMQWLIDAYGLSGILTLPVLNFLKHGGNMTESNAHENTSRIAEMYRAWPLLSLIAGCLPNQILRGKLIAHRGTLICEENRELLQREAGDAIPTRRLRPAEDLIGNQQYVRFDAITTSVNHMSPGEHERIESGEILPGESLHSETKKRKLQNMPFSGQAVNRGAAFFHGFTVPHATTIEIGALILSLRLWQFSEGGTIGGQSSRGHGRLAMSLIGEGYDDEVNEYVDYARSVKADALDWLRDAFGRKEEKSAKPKKAKAAT